MKENWIDKIMDILSWGIDIIRITFGITRILIHVFLFHKNEEGESCAGWILWNIIIGSILIGSIYIMSKGC